MIGYKMKSAPRKPAMQKQHGKSKKQIQQVKKGSDPNA
jgi:hypothetical protein